MKLLQILILGKVYEDEGADLLIIRKMTAIVSREPIV